MLNCKKPTSITDSGHDPGARGAASGAAACYAAMIVHKIPRLISNYRLLDPAPRHRFTLTLPAEPVAIPGHPAFGAA